MMDCRKTEVFLHEWKRMCETSGCGNCDMNLLPGPCGVVARERPVKAIKIVQEWSDRHPVRTRINVLLEKFPDAMLFPNGEPTMCAKSIFGSDIECTLPKKITEPSGACFKCWQTPVEDGE